MTHIKENDLMRAFYLATPPLQKQILSEYQHHASKDKSRKNLLTFLEERFRHELTMRRSGVNRSPQNLSA